MKAEYMELTMCFPGGVGRTEKQKADFQSSQLNSYQLTAFSERFGIMVWFYPVSIPAFIPLIPVHASFSERLGRIFARTG
jgi:hypothetical protein